MRFPSLSRREEPAPAVADNDADRTGAVATDTRPGTRPAAEEETDRRSGHRSRAEATGTTATDRVPAGRDKTGGAAADRALAGARDARTGTGEAAARAATARSGIAGFRRARAAAPAPEPAVKRGRTVEHDRDADADRTIGHERIVTGDPNATVDRESVPDVPPMPAGPRPRTSLLATLGLVAGVAGLLFVLTGTLAGYGIGLGAAGAVLAVLGLIATRRRHVAGKPDALLGIVFGLGAVVVGVLAMTGQYDWPTTDGDTVARLREWLDSQLVDRL
ncbi:DUF308 domain-containing protein [Micromonospora sp. NPDC051296]|uniref:DUF308 domain-containing protein n=1 Tax=Micromonospora sp. NPDC051296 TaxID=3155046 RepID=UPI0034316F77